MSNLSRWRVRRRIAVPVAAGAAALAIAGGAFAATSGILTDTGTVIPGSSPSTGEILNIGAPDAAAVGRKITEGIQFAPGYGAWRSEVIEADLAGPSGQGPVGAAVTSSGAVKYAVASAAICSWAHYWVASATAGDTTAASAAANEIEQSPSWVSTAATGLTGPTGLGPAVDAVKAGDVQLVRGMIDAGGMIPAGGCSALGPNGVLPTGMTWQQLQAKLAALAQVGDRAILGDPEAETINRQVLNSPEMGTAIGTFLQRQDQPFLAKLEQQASQGGTSPTAIGEQLVRDHPLPVYTATSAAPAGGAGQAPGGLAQPIGGVAVGAELLGMQTSNLPQTVGALQASGQQMHTALDLALTVFSADPLAAVLNRAPASS